jgi:hypothetical protein
MTIKYTGAPLVPLNPRETVRTIFELPYPITLEDLMKTKDGQLLIKEFKQATKDASLPVIDESIFKSTAPLYEIEKVTFDYVDQRFRLKTKAKRRKIINFAKNIIDWKLSFPTWSIDEYDVVRGPGWQKRAISIWLLGYRQWPANIIKVPLKYQAELFNSQDENKDKIEPYLGHKTKLAEGNIEAWAIDRALTKNNVTTDPDLDIPYVDGFRYIHNSMLNPHLNPLDANERFEDKKFETFSRAIKVHKEVFPNHSKKRFGGSIISGFMSVIASLEDVTQGDDTLLIKILKEAKDPQYKIRKNKQEEWEGFTTPTHFTTMGWQGSKLIPTPIITTAKMWNKIVQHNQWPNFPVINNDCIADFEASAELFRKMK